MECGFYLPVDEEVMSDFDDSLCTSPVLQEIDKKLWMAMSLIVLILGVVARDITVDGGKASFIEAPIEQLKAILERKYTPL